MGRTKQAGNDAVDEILLGRTEESRTSSVVGPSGPGVGKEGRSGSPSSLPLELDQGENVGLASSYGADVPPRRNPTAGDTDRTNFATGPQPVQPKVRRARNGQREPLPRH